IVYVTVSPATALAGLTTFATAIMGRTTVTLAQAWPGSMMRRSWSVYTRRAVFTWELPSAPSPFTWTVTVKEFVDPGRTFVNVQPSVEPATLEGGRSPRPTAPPPGAG